MCNLNLKCTFEGGMCDEWKGPDANTGWVFEMIGERMDYEWEVVRGPQHRLVSNIDSIVKYDSYRMSPLILSILQFFETSESIFTGPRIDHTRKSVYGRYLYASGLDSEGGDYYVIQSPYLDLSYSQGSHGFCTGQLSAVDIMSWLSRTSR